VSVYVSAAHRRLGVGRQLLADGIRRAPDFGLHTLVGYIFGHNAPSLGLFESFGFGRWGLLPRVAELEGIERDLVIVGRRLDT
jgi:phosphinothricin acetyltransferase